MTLDEYNELLLQDELKIGYGIPEDEDLPTQYDNESYTDELLTDGFNAVYDPLDELFGEPIAGYSLS
jgi:hypothetical protein|tara:strand:+ start:217 stop:417 length:201 start_codon:yes stop_codon:yes gene_type:complete